jgi:homoserine dehydrogenase
MRIILVGYGVVGKGVTTILAKRYTEKVKDGFNPKIVAIADIDGAVINPRGLSPEKLEAVKQKGYPISADPDFGQPGVKALDVIQNVEAEVVVEVTPVNIKNGEPAISHITTAFKTGKHVVTTNKGPLALAMPALTELAEYNNVFLRFSGTVGGGTPMLEFAKRCLAGDRILAIRGILNGTTNYILTEMSQNHVTFADALANAQKLGYAEREPSMDIDGFDTACKTVILANWIMNKKITLKDVDRTGIRDVTLKQLEDASKRGNTLKLIGGVPPLVPAFSAGPFDRLFDRIRGQHAEDTGYPGTQGYGGNPFRHFIRHIVEMRRGAPDHRTQADDRVIPS